MTLRPYIDVCKGLNGPPVVSECAPTSGGADKLTSSSTLFTYFIYIHSPRHSSLASNLIHLVHTPCSCPCPKPTSLLNAQQPTEQCLHRLTPVDPRLPPDNFRSSTTVLGRLFPR